MIDEILINTGPRRHRIALLQGGRLMELHVVLREIRWPDRVILGRVTKVRQDLDAAFVDIGEGREGLLAARDTVAKRGTAISQSLTEGQSLLVQVKREAENEKGAKLTARPGLSGRGVVFLPRSGGVQLPHQISNSEQRRRLQSLAGTFSGDALGGWMIRGGAATMSDASLRDEADALLQRWAEITRAAAIARPPVALDAGDEPIMTIVRQYTDSGLRSLRVDDKRVLRGLSRLSAIAELHDGMNPLFDEYDVAWQIEEALTPEIPLPSGGRIIIEHTQALTAIDVDSGGHDGRGDPARLAGEVNEQAGREIARQLRLREIGGRVVIDFIPMRRKGDAQSLLAKMQNWLDEDPGSVRLGRISEMGLLELTRRRRQPALSLRLTVACPYCNSGRRLSPRWVADNLLDSLLREARIAKGRLLVVRAAPAVAADFKEKNDDWLHRISRDYGARIELSADPALSLEQFQVEVLE